jgi:hypothetical protein
LLAIVVIVGALTILLGQGIVRNVEVFEDAYMRQAPLQPKDQTIRYRAQPGLSDLLTLHGRHPC